MVLKDAIVTRTNFSVVILSLIFALATKRIDYIFELCSREVRGQEMKLSTK